jgi:hypothetical protein
MMTDRKFARELAVASMCFGADRSCLRKDGRPKLLYPTRRAAKDAASKYQAVYACVTMPGFHVGHNRRHR